MSVRTLGRYVGATLATIVFIACVYYLLERYEWRESFRVLLKTDFAKLVSAVFCVHCAYICVRTLRWQVVVRDTNPDIGFGSLYWITAIVVSLSVLTPGQLGEAIKVELLKRRGLLGRLPGLGAFAIERVFDLLTISGFGIIGLAFGSGLSDKYHGLPVLAGALFAIGLGALYFLIAGVASASSPDWVKQLRSGTGTRSIRAKMFTLTVASWCLVGLGWQVSLYMVNIHVSLASMCWLVSLVTLGTLLSLIPGGVGIAEVLTVEALANMGAGPTAAQTGALILRVYGLVIILFGLCHLTLWPFFRSSTRS